MVASWSASVGEGFCLPNAARPAVPRLYSWRREPALPAGFRPSGPWPAGKVNYPPRRAAAACQNAQWSSRAARAPRSVVA